MPERAKYTEGFQSVPEEQEIKDLPVEGKIPDWLSGDLIRTSPGKFEIGDRQLAHWFDGFALLHKFRIRGNQVSYCNRFLQSDAYCEAMKTGRLQRGEFATDPSRSIFEKVASIFNPTPPTDNGNVNIIRIGGKLAAVSETTVQNVIEPASLETKGHFEYEDELEGTVTVSHPHYDEAGNLISYVVDFGRTSNYIIYRQPFGSHQREVIARVKTDRPSYMHSFGMTDRYIILAEFPLVARPLSMRLSFKAFIENYEWQPDRGIRFRVIDRYSGKETVISDNEPFFAFHHVNAFERGNKILLDMVVYPDASIIDEFYLNHLRAPGYSIATAHLFRVELDLNQNEVSNEWLLSDAAIELPRINPEYLRRPYRYCYGASNDVPGNFIDSIVKVDVTDGSFHKWAATGCYPGEPIFVPKPGSAAEDDGVLLSIVLDAYKGQSFLLVLDAGDLRELGRAEIPTPVPFGFHGQFLE